MIRYKVIEAALRVMQSESEPCSETIADHFDLTSEEENILVDMYYAAQELETEAN